MQTLTEAKTLHGYTLPLIAEDRTILDSSENGGEMLCMVHLPISLGSDFDSEDKALEAAGKMARLFAAAPELLDACHTIKSYLDNLESKNDDPALSAVRRRFHAPLRSALESAIAKAEPVTI